MKTIFPRHWSTLALVLFALTACGKHGQAEDVPALPAQSSAPVHYSYVVVHAWRHDPGAFTQGLVYRDGDLLESTGLYGRSTLRDLELESGRVLKEVSIPSQYFAEGLTVLGGKAYQLTWQNHVGFIYDAATFRPEGEFHYDGEGWGLATDGSSLILSDGSSEIRFIDPATFRVIRSINVTAGGRPVDRLNELEWIKGEIFANVWQTDEILRIDPATGIVRGIIDLSGLRSAGDTDADDVLNGIAYDPAGGRLFVTGKRWTKIFEIRLIAEASPH